MKRFITVLPGILLIVFIVVFSKCIKEYSYEGGKGTSGYIFVGSPDSCTNPVISGNYYAGDTLDERNTITLLVDVIRPGTYLIQTNIADGITFSATGTFFDSGRQVLVLTGSGVPDTTGDFIIQIPGTNGCYFTIMVREAPKAVYTLAGEPQDCTNPIIKGEYVQNGGTTGLNTVTLNVSVTAPGTYNITTDTVDGISFSASGVFEATGDQQVVLEAAGDIGDIGFQELTVTAGASECSFIVPVTNNQPFATYVLESIGGKDSNPCAYAPLSSAAFKAGLSLNPKYDYFDVEVYVTDYGNYSVGTRPLNGMSFYGAGKFTTLGEQMIRLGGHGTPQITGTFPMMPEILGPSPIGGQICSVNIKVN